MWPFGKRGLSEEEVQGLSGEALHSDVPTAFASHKAEQLFWKRRITRAYLSFVAAVKDMAADATYEEACSVIDEAEASFKKYTPDKETFERVFPILRSYRVGLLSPTLSGLRVSDPDVTIMMGAVSMAKVHNAWRIHGITKHSL